VSTTQPIEVVFFDIGGTLGKPVGTTLDPFPSSAPMLKRLRDVVGLRIGIITTLGSLSNAQGRALLEGAGLASFVDPNGFVSEHDVAGEVAKPSPKIYQTAAQKVGVEIGRCLFVGENLIEVIGARAAGMQAILKPSPPGNELPL